MGTLWGMQSSVVEWQKTDPKSVGVYLREMGLWLLGPVEQTLSQQSNTEWLLECIDFFPGNVGICWISEW